MATVRRSNGVAKKSILPAKTRHFNGKIMSPGWSGIRTDHRVRQRGQADRLLTVDIQTVKFKVISDMLNLRGKEYKFHLGDK